MKDVSLNIDKQKLKQLYQLKPYKFVLAILLEWSIILGTTYLCISFFNIVFYFFAVCIIGARMHAMAVLMHDSSHYRFLHNRMLNDLLTNIFLSWPLLFPVQDYRKNHDQHHKFLNTSKDPDWVAVKDLHEFRFPQTKREFIIRLLLYLPAIQTIKDMSWTFKRLNQYEKPLSMKIKMAAFYLTMAAILTYLGWWLYFLLYWFIPLMTTFSLVVYLRSYAEHYGDLEYEDANLNGTRSVMPTLVERFFVAPYHIYYHIEHHLYPGVPFYNLPALHRLLMEDPNFAANAHYTKGYFKGLLEELA